MVLEKTLESPLNCRQSKQSILKEISPNYSLEGLMLKLKLQYFGHLMRRVDSLEKSLMLGGIGGRRRRGQQKMRWLDGITATTGTLFFLIIFPSEGGRYAVVPHAEYLASGYRHKISPRFNTRGNSLPI